MYGAGLAEHLVNGTPYFFLVDGLGSTAAIVDQSGTTVQSYTYDVYGKATASSQTFGNEVQFAGQETDPSGLQYLRARYYDPSTGRLLSRDPAPSCTYDPASHHPYTYAANGPASQVDPSGLYDTGLVNGQVFQDPFSGAYSIYSSATGGLVPVPAAQAPQLAASIQQGAALLQAQAAASAQASPQATGGLAAGSVANPDGVGPSNPQYLSVGPGPSRGQLVINQSCAPGQAAEFFFQVPYGQGSVTPTFSVSGSLVAFPSTALAGCLEPFGCGQAVLVTPPFPFVSVNSLIVAFSRGPVVLAPPTEEVPFPSGCVIYGV